MRAPPRPRLPWRILEHDEGGAESSPPVPTSLQKSVPDGRGWARKPPQNCQTQMAASNEKNVTPTRRQWALLSHSPASAGKGVPHPPQSSVVEICDCHLSMLSFLPIPSPGFPICWKSPHCSWAMEVPMCVPPANVWDSLFPHTPTHFWCEGASEYLLWPLLPSFAFC